MIHIRWSQATVPLTDVSLLQIALSPQQLSFGCLWMQKMPSGWLMMWCMYLGLCHIKICSVWCLSQGWTWCICTRSWGHCGRWVKPFVGGTGPIMWSPLSTQWLPRQALPLQKIQHHRQPIQWWQWQLQHTQIHQCMHPQHCPAPPNCTNNDDNSCFLATRLSSARLYSCRVTAQHT